jgi:hypothetical protein
MLQCVDFFSSLVAAHIMSGIVALTCSCTELERRILHHGKLKDIPAKKAARVLQTLPFGCSRIGVHR